MYLSGCRQWVTPRRQYSSITVTSACRLHKSPGGYWFCAPSCEELHCPFRAFRFGEASHPGPSHTRREGCLKFAVLNPTAIHNKECTLLELDADVMCISETSAVVGVQDKFRSNMFRHRYRSYFGAPVEPNCSDVGFEHSVRGLSGGVAIVSRLPSRPSPQSFHPELVSTTRITEAFTRWGALEVRCICVYGIPQSHAEARQLNTFLLEAAFQRVTSSRVPSIIAGDMNLDVTSLDVWAHFAQLGFVEAFQLAYARLGTVLPPTCKQATRFDTAILSPCLVPLLSGAQVLTEFHGFDSHSPLLLEFSACRVCTDGSLLALGQISLSLPPASPCITLWSPQLWMTKSMISPPPRTRPKPSSNGHRWSSMLLMPLCEQCHMQPEALPPHGTCRVPIEAAASQSSGWSVHVRNWLGLQEVEISFLQWRSPAANVSCVSSNVDELKHFAEV